MYYIWRVVFFYWIKRCFLFHISVKLALIHISRLVHLHYCVRSKFLTKLSKFLNIELIDSFYMDFGRQALSAFKLQIQNTTKQKFILIVYQSMRAECLALHRLSRWNEIHISIESFDINFLNLKLNNRK